jgi:Ca2+ transporting ATPase
MEKRSNNDGVELGIKNGGEEKDKLREGYFGLTKLQVDELMTKYEHRTNEEELIYIELLGKPKGIADKLITNFDNGISEINEQELQERINSFGENKLEEEELKHFCEFVLEALGDMMLQILIVAAIIQTVLGATISDEPGKDWIDGISIIIAVVCVVSVGSITNYQKEKKFKQLNDTNSKMITFGIVRDGKPSNKQSDDIKVGDIVNLNIGMILPADGLLISSGGTIKMDESALTGESDLIKKETYDNCLLKKEELLAQGKKIDKKHTLPSPILFSGTTVADGTGKYMVLAVGPNSMKGKIKEIVKQSQDAEDSKTPLEEKLDIIAGQIGYFGLLSAIITLIALFISFGIQYVSKNAAFISSNQTALLLKTIEDNSHDFDNNEFINNKIIEVKVDPRTTVAKTVLDIFLLCVAIVVVAIPEGLPLAVTLALAFSINKMMKENNLVRKMQACETMGGANYICSDKTGTLTKNIMCVVKLYDGNDVHDTEKISSDSSEFSPFKFFRNTEYYKLLKLSLCLNIEATIDENEVVTKPNKSDLGFIELFHHFKERIYDIRKQYLPSKDVKTFSFNSDRKRMSTFVKNSEFPTGHRMFIKGASDILLDRFATHYIDPRTNQQIILSDSKKSEFHETLKKFADNTLRTILICYKDITEHEYNNYQEMDENGEFKIEKTSLIVIAIAGIRDTLRLGVPLAVQKCHEAGIKVIMVTGDLKETAIAIAKQCNIIDENGEDKNANLSELAMTG